MLISLYHVTYSYYKHTYLLLFCIKEFVILKTQNLNALPPFFSFSFMQESPPPLPALPVPCCERIHLKLTFTFYLLKNTHQESMSLFL